MGKQLPIILSGLGLTMALQLTAGVAAAAPPSGAAKPAPASGGSASSGAPETDDAKKAEAKTRFQNGLSLYDEGAFDAARVQFERAYALAPSYKILYNVGLVYKQLNEFVGSLKALEQYLAEGGKEVPEDRRQEATKLIESLRKIIASANVNVNVPGAEITVDDAVVGKAPLSGPVMINPGRRKIGAKAQGKLPDNKVVTVAGGDRITVDLNLTESVVINQGTDVKPIIAWAATGGLAIGAGVTAFLANGASDDREALRSRRDVTKADLDDALEKQQTLSLVSDILTVATIVGIGASVYLTWFNKPSEKASPDKPKDAPAAAKAVKVTPGIGSLRVTF